MFSFGGSLDRDRALWNSLLYLDSGELGLEGLGVFGLVDFGEWRAVASGLKNDNFRFRSAGVAGWEVEIRRWDMGQMVGEEGEDGDSVEDENGTASSEESVGVVMFDVSSAPDGTSYGGIVK